MKSSKAPKARKKWLIPVAVGVPVFLLLAGAAGYYFYMDGKYNDAVSCIERHDCKAAVSDLSHVIGKYKDAERYMQYATAYNGLESNDFATAKLYFSQLGDFLDSSTMLKETDYQQAQFALKNKQYDDAKKTFAGLGEYKDSADMSIECDYRKAAWLVSTGGYDAAKSLFKALGSYKDSESMLDECDYQKAASMLGTGGYDAAKNLFKALGSYKDSVSMQDECDYQKAASMLGGGDYDGAKSLFQSLGSYKDSASMPDECDYQQARHMLDIKSIGAAKELFATLKGKSYKDAEQMMNECDYQAALQLYEAKSWVNAYHRFMALAMKPYKDSVDYVQKAIDNAYADAIAKYRSGDYTNSQSVFSVLDVRDSWRYLILCKAHQVKTFDDKSMFSSLSSLAATGFEDAEALRQSDYFIRFRLQGRWKDSANNYYIELKSSGQNWVFNYLLPADSGGGNYRIEGCIIYLGADNDMKPAYKITFISENQISVYCYENGRIISLAR